MQYSLTRSRRKTMTLRITSDLTVDVRAPFNVPRRQIDAFVHKHEGWIRTNMAQMAQELQEKQAFQYRDGDRLLFRGEQVFLAATRTGPPRLEGSRLLLPEGVDREAAVTSFLREATRKQVGERIEYYSIRMGVRPTGVKITSAVTRWGSCSGKNSLCFTYRLACVPDFLLDYVVVHELAHILQHNHSPQFWAVVASVLPDYEARRRLLRDYHRKIAV